MREPLLTDLEIKRALALIDQADARFRIYDLRNNPLTTEELHARVYAWYDREYAGREAVQFVQANRRSFSNRNPSDVAWLRRSRGQRRRKRA